MMASLATLAVIALTVGPTKDIGTGMGCGNAVARAETDFEARRAELGLIGSAPLIGLERVESATSQDFEARRTELGLIGSAPMLGLERLNHRAPIARTVSDPGSGASVAKISNTRSRTQ